MKNKVNPKKILVTGGTGYIGSHTVVSLIEAGYEVVVLDNLVNSQISVLDGIEKICGHKPAFSNTDLKNAKATEAFFNEHSDIAGIIHFAAYKAVGESVEKPLDYYYNNLISLMHLMQNMRLHQIPHIVFSSSCTVYGQPEKLPVSEEAPVQTAQSPYGNTKQICEEILYDEAATDRLAAISLRYFNPIGAHESAHIGELPIGVPGNLVPFITQTAIGKRKALTIFGNDYPTNDGTCLRDYIHVMDLAVAHVIAMKRLHDKKAEQDFEVFNIGTGKAYSVREVVDSFEKVSGQNLNIIEGSRRAGDVTAVYADTHKANRILGWKARRSLEEMLISAWKWEVRLKG